jgi:hypothetical protein
MTMCTMNLFDTSPPHEYRQPVRAVAPAQLASPTSAASAAAVSLEKMQTQAERVLAFIRGKGAAGCTRHDIERHFRTHPPEIPLASVCRTISAEQHGLKVLGYVIERGHAAGAGDGAQRGLLVAREFAEGQQS